MYVFKCGIWHVHMWAGTCTYTNMSEEARGRHQVSCLSQNVELGWWPTSSIDCPVPTFHRTGITSTHSCAWLLHGYWDLNATPHSLWAASTLPHQAISPTLELKSYEVHLEIRLKCGSFLAAFVDRTQHFRMGGGNSKSHKQEGSLLPKVTGKESTQRLHLVIIPINIFPWIFQNKAILPVNSVLLIL